MSNKKVKEEEKLRNKLSRYVGENLLEKLMNSKGEGFFENERKELTVLFADIRSFTTIAEKMTPEDLIIMLNEYFEIMVGTIFKNKGLLDKFVGDQIIAVFGLISSEIEAPLHALQAAVEMQAATKELMETRAKQEKETFGIGIGINTGNVIMGNLGSKNRMDYTVIGDTVNIAARLQQEAKSGEILIGEQTLNKSQGAFRITKIGAVHLKNKTVPITCYRIDGLKQDCRNL
ncbi:adenylate/guanylate cyclase domain-containing protein [Thermodesulfobacteriota bacterium]